MDLNAYGRDLLTDLGRYNYSDHTPLRKALKESSAHNTTVVDGIGFTGIKDTWSFDRIAGPLGCRWISKPEFDYVEGRMTAISMGVIRCIRAEGSSLSSLIFGC